VRHGEVAASMADSGAGDPARASASLPVLSRDRLLSEDRFGLEQSFGAVGRRAHDLRPPGTNKPSTIATAVVVASLSAGGATCFRCCCCPLAAGRRMSSARAGAERAGESSDLGVDGGLTLDDSARFCRATIAEGGTMRDEWCSGRGDPDSGLATTLGDGRRNLLVFDPTDATSGEFRRSEPSSAVLQPFSARF